MSSPNLSDKAFLKWLADRLVNVYHESENVDFVLRLKKIAAAVPPAAAQPPEQTMEPRCELCGEPMPAGEEMFKYHGYSGPCPKPGLRRWCADS